MRRQGGRYCSIPEEKMLFYPPTGQRQFDYTTFRKMKINSDVCKRKKKKRAP
jgi:hypothetical protein